MKNKVMKVAKLPIVLGVILFLALGSLIVYAATNASDVKSNDLDIGVLKGDVKEEFTESTEVSQDTEVKKEVAVENTGNTPLYARVMLFPEVLSSDSKILPAIIGKQIVVDFDFDKNTDSEWIDGNDGYYYYKKKLNSGEVSSNLITNVKINSAETTEEYVDANLTIYTKSETVYASGDSYLQAWSGVKSLAQIVDNTEEDAIKVEDTTQQTSADKGDK